MNFYDKTRKREQQAELIIKSLKIGNERLSKKINKKSKRTILSKKSHSQSSFENSSSEKLTLSYIDKNGNSGVVKVINSNLQKNNKLRIIQTHLFLIL